jgi:hypothetical protein
MRPKDDVLVDMAMMSHQQIVERFKNVFGREKTSAERQALFLWKTSGRHPAARCSMPLAHARLGGLRSDARSEIN